MRISAATAIDRATVVQISLHFVLFNLIYGTWMLVQGIELRRTARPCTSVPFGLPHLGNAAMPQVRSFGPDVFG